MAVPILNDLIIIFNQYPLISGAGLLIAVAFISIIIYKDRFVEDDRFDSVEIEDRVKGQLDEIAKVFGKDPKKNFSHGFKTVGRVSEALVTGSVTTEFDPSDKDEVEKISGSDQDSEVQDIAVLKVRPIFKHDLRKWMSWKIKDDILEIEDVHNLMVMKLDSVQIGEEIHVPHNLNFTKTAGVFVEDTEDGQSFIRETAYQDILNDSLTTFGNVVELMNLMNIEYSTDIARLEKELEIYQEMDDKDDRTVGRLNND